MYSGKYYGQRGLRTTPHYAYPEHPMMRYKTEDYNSKISGLCFVVINSILLNFLSVWISGRKDVPTTRSVAVNIMTSTEGLCGSGYRPAPGDDVKADTSSDMRFIVNIFCDRISNLL